LIDYRIIVIFKSSAMEKNFMTTDFSQDLPSLLGREIDDAEVTKYLKSLDEDRNVRRTSLNEPRWISEDAGMEVHAAPKTRRIFTVFLYAEGASGFKPYKGVLPHGLNFSMDMDAVKGCFPRKPDFSSDEHCTWDFDDYRLIVSFEEGITNGITDVTFTSDF
jgi:hypothetical protein